MPIPDVRGSQEPLTPQARELALQSLVDEEAQRLHQYATFQDAMMLRSEYDCARFLRAFLSAARLILDHNTLLEANKNARSAAIAKQKAIAKNKGR